MSVFEVPAFISAPSQLVDEYAGRRLSRRAASGELVRVRRGLYLPTDQWRAFTSWEKFRVNIQAVHETAAGSPVFARQSAAQILGLPLIRIPPLVQTVIPPGQGGGRSSNGVHRIMGVRGDPEPWLVDGLLTTPPVQTARDLAVHLPLAHALVAMDRLLGSAPLSGTDQNGASTFTRQDVTDSLELLPNATQQRRVERVLTLASPLAGSAGESLSRAIMIENGFPAPVLQQRFEDARGLIGYPDFTWEEYKVVGEFDGHEKYSQQRYLRGRTPSEVVIAEKNRENRLRALGFNVVRWEWADLLSPERLIRLLHDAGLPHSVR